MLKDKHNLKQKTCGIDVNSLKTFFVKKHMIYIHNFVIIVIYQNNCRFYSSYPDMTQNIAKEGRLKKAYR